MLLTLRRPTKKKKILKIPGAFAAPFNPLNLPSYQAGYLMNLTTDVPPGSIVAAPSAAWYEAKNLNPLSKQMVRGSQTVVSNVNGFKCEDIDTANARLRNVTLDILTGVSSFSYVFGFKRGLATTDHIILSARNDADTAFHTTRLTGAGLLQGALGNGGAFAVGNSVSRYDDNAWHALVCVVDQTTKSVRLITHTGEDITATNALMGAPLNFTMTNQNYFQFGFWWVATFNFTPGLFGDVVILNAVISNTLINQLMAWECNRLGIVHVPI